MEVPIVAKSKLAIGDYLAETLGGVSVSDSDTSARLIPLEKLVPNPRNFYPTPTSAALNALIESIVANGLLEPLTVTPDSGDKFRIISGHSRWRALQSLEVRTARPDLWHGVPCVVLPSMSEAQEITAVIEANRQRIKGSALIAEEAQKLTEAYVKRKDAGEQLPGRIRDLVAQEMRLSATKLATVTAIRNNLVVPGFRQKWKDGELGESVAYEISKLAPDVQYRLLDWSIDHGEPVERYMISDVKCLGIALDATPRKCPHDEDHQCCNALRMYHAHYRGGNWFCSGCCDYCRDRDTCPTTCKYWRAKQSKPDPQTVPKNPALKDPRASGMYTTDKFCPRLREARERTGMEKKAFAESINEFPGTYSAWENKSLPSCSSIPKLALCLGVSADYLLGLSDDPQPGPHWRTDDAPDGTEAVLELDHGDGGQPQKLIAQRRDGAWTVGTIKIKDTVRRWLPLPKED